MKSNEISLKQILSLIKYNLYEDEEEFKKVASDIAKKLEEMGKDDLAVYVYSLLGMVPTFSPGGGEIKEKPTIEWVQNKFRELAAQWSNPVWFMHDNDRTPSEQMEEAQGRIVDEMTRIVKRYATAYAKDKRERRKRHYEANRLGLAGNQDRNFYMDRLEEPRIVAAAIMWKAKVMTGVRHGHIIKDIVELGLIKDPEIVLSSQQGFIDQYGKYYSREKARDVAIAAKQVKPDHGTLYSEDLW